MRHFILAASFAAIAAPALAQDVEFTAPADGSTVAIGDVVAPTGIASNGSAAGLDLTFVIDTSGSVASNGGTGDGRTRLDVQVDAAQELIDSLLDGTSVSAVRFSSSASNVYQDIVLGASSRAAAKDPLDNLGAGGGTNFSAALAQVISNGVASGDRVLFFSDGSGSGGLSQATAIASSGGIVDTVALPGASIGRLEGIAQNGNGTFFDLRSNPGDILSVLTGVGSGGAAIGLTGLSALLPDGTTTTVTANAFGQFTLPDFAIASAGANVFQITATFDDGSSRTDTLTLNVPVTGGGGGTGGIAPIPLPAGAWLMIGALAGLGALRRRA